jgi:hypothetical protein
VRGARWRLSARAAAWPVTVAGLAAVTTAYVATHNPHLQGALPGSHLLLAHNIYCPGCGATRAVYDLAHGDVAGALSMNPLFVLAVPLLGVLWVRWLARGQGFRLKDWPFPTAAGWIVPGIIVLFTVLRNTPMFAPYLAP